MCTVSFLARRNGYALGMNRDEKLSRVTACPPALHRAGGRDALFPSEPGGGTWIGVNDAGVTVAVVNWYSAEARVVGQRVSRGEVVSRTLAADSAARVDAVLGEMPLAWVNPFRLIGVVGAAKAVVEWRWNLRCLQRLHHPWRSSVWVSSGFDEPGAQQTRGKTFARALGEPSAGSLEWLRRLHGAHRPERGPYSICMHRDDAATVSYTEVSVSRGKASMRYASGAPCCTALAGPFHLQFGC
jgi:hypothetical protein